MKTFKYLLVCAVLTACGNPTQYSQLEQDIPKSENKKADTFGSAKFGSAKFSK